MSNVPDKSSQIIPVNQGEAYKVGPGRPPLETRFQKGKSGNRLGRPSAGLTVKEWINAMRNWPLKKIEKVANDPATGNAKALAAGVWLDARNRRGNDFDRIMDQTIGKPKQAVDMKLDATVTQGEAVQAAMERILTDSEALAAAEIIANRINADVGPEPGA